MGPAVEGTFLEDPFVRSGRPENERGGTGWDPVSERLIVKWDPLRRFWIGLHWDTSGLYWDTSGSLLVQGCHARLRGADEAPRSLPPSDLGSE